MLSGETPMRKIMISGRPGSGKSTFAYWLHQETGIPLYHLDGYFFVENWIERDYQVFLEIQQDMLQTSGWIIDGNSIHSLEMRYAKAEVVLYFNYPKWLCALRILKRYFFKNPFLQDRAYGCKEKLRWRLFRYMWNFENRVAARINALKSRYPCTPFYEVKSNRDLEHFVTTKMGRKNGR